MNYREIYDEGRKVLALAGIAEADLDARLLLEEVCGTDRNTLLVHGDREVSEAESASFREYIDSRAKRIPLQHITGSQEFMGLTFKVSGDVLIPRQDTEILVEEVLTELHDGMKILDMCTGSGCILTSLLHYSNGCQGTGADISPAALDIARENASVLLAERIASAEEGCEPDFNFVESDLFEKIEGRFDVIVSNPPYIAREVIETLAPEVRDFEPGIALDGGEDGLTFYRKIVEGSAEHLVRGGYLFFEIGYDQAEAVSKLMADAGFKEITVVKDYAGLDRVVRGILF